MVIFSPSNARNPQGNPTLRRACEREYCYCEKPVECDGCLPGTPVFELRVETLGFITGLCTACNILNRTWTLNFFPLGAGQCRWRSIDDPLICEGELPAAVSVGVEVFAASGNWIVNILFNSLGAGVNDGPQYRLPMGADPFDCSDLPQVIPYFNFDTQYCGNATNLTVTIQAPAGGSMGAMFDPDCQPEMRRGKPVIPKGRRRG